MGIGAHQAREYVQGLGGHVEVQSTPGEGTAFSIILPVAKASAAQTAVTEQGWGGMSATNYQRTMGEP